MHRSIFLIPFLAIACATTGSSTPAPIARKASETTCTLAGRYEVYSHVEVRDDRDGALAFIRAGTWNVRAEGLPAKRLRLFARNAEAHVRVEGFVAEDALSIRAARDLPIVPGAVWIAKGAEVAVRGRGGELSVAPTDVPGWPVDVKADCSDLGFAHSPAVDLPPSDFVAYVVGEHASLAARPGGATVFDVPKNLDDRKTELLAYERKGGFVHVRFSLGLVLDGWIHESELEVIKEEASGYGGLGMTGIGRSTPPRTVVRESAVTLRPEPLANVAAIAEPGARVHVLREVGVFAEVRIVDSGLDAPDDEAFFLPLDALGPP